MFLTAALDSHAMFASFASFPDVFSPALLVPHYVDIETRLKGLEALSHLEPGDYRVTSMCVDTCTGAISTDSIVPCWLFRPCRMQVRSFRRFFTKYAAFRLLVLCAADCMQNTGAMRMPHRCWLFALTVVRHPETGRFLIIEEARQRGFWLPGGRVEAGESFAEAAVRECEEEAGIRVKLDGILKLEHTPSVVHGEGDDRMRVIFLASPVNLEQQPKSVADKESVRAFWVDWDKLEERCSPLRGPEPEEWFRYVANGGSAAPLALLGDEY